jgi:hypothetical protein
MFSWITSDTKRSILVDGTVPVKMISPDGREFEERNYEGYGVFGGVDFYSLVAELNGKGTDRIDGINLVFNSIGGNPNGVAKLAADNGVVLPKLVSIDFRGDYEDVPHTESCPNQGFFDDDDENTCNWCGEDLEYCTCDEDEEC